MAIISEMDTNVEDIKGKAIHNPYGRGTEQIAKIGCPKLITDHKVSRKHALAKYRLGLEEVLLERNL